MRSGSAWRSERADARSARSSSTELSPAAVAVAFTFPAVIGVFFGLYPAHRGSRLDPIETLRYE